MKTRTSITAAVAAAVLAAFNISATAAPGDLDPTFGTGGKVTTAIGGDNDYCQSMAVQDDGKILLAGYSDNGSNDDFALARYNSDGSPDGSFNGSGFVTTPMGTSSAYGNGVAVQADGKIVVAGYCYNGGHPDFALARYNDDGSLDTSFGTGGRVTTGSDGDYGFGQGLAVQSDGRIVVAGWCYTGTNGDFAVSRYDTDGSLDTTFGADGRVITDMGTNEDACQSVVLQDDEKIVVAGYSGAGANSDFALARYNEDGSLDTTFGTGGIVKTPFGSGWDRSYSVAVQGDGKIVAAGDSFNGSTVDVAVARYNSDGSLDTTFDTDGRVTAAFGTNIDRAYSVALQADGKILVAGECTVPTYDFGLARFNSDGSLDLTFNGTGKVTTAISTTTDYCRGVAVQGDGRIVVAGCSYIGGHLDFALARYTVAQGDARVGPNAAIARGENLYNLTGAGQTQNVVIRHGGGVKNVFIGIQNDGPLDASFTVRGTRGSGLFRVKYLHGKANVTGQVQAGAFSTGVLAPGATCLLKAQITAATRLKGKARNFCIQSTSAADASGADCVLIKAKSN